MAWMKHPPSVGVAFGQPREPRRRFVLWGVRPRPVDVQIGSLEDRQIQAHRRSVRGGFVGFALKSARVGETVPIMLAPGRGSFHYGGRAMDVVGDPREQMLWAARYMQRRYSAGTGWAGSWVRTLDDWDVDWAPFGERATYMQSAAMEANALTLVALARRALAVRHG